MANVLKRECVQRTAASIRPSEPEDEAAIQVSCFYQVTNI